MSSVSLLALATLRTHVVEQDMFLSSMILPNTLQVQTQLYMARRYHRQLEIITIKAALAKEQMVGRLVPNHPLHLQRDSHWSYVQRLVKVIHTGGWNILTR